MGNIFTELAKTFASLGLNKILKQIEREMKEDPSIIATVDSIRYHNNVLEKLLPDFCKRHPESSLCKDKTESKGKK